MEKKVYKENVPLTDFPNLVSALKHAINKALSTYHNGDVATAVMMVVTNCQRIYTWMIRKGLYRLKQLSKTYIDVMLKDVAKHGWWRTLNYREALKKILEDGKKDKGILEASNGSSNVPRLTINNKALQKAIGLPLSATDIPGDFIEELALALGIESGRSPDHPAGLQPSRAGLKATLNCLNFLANLPETQDSLPTYPISNVQKKIEELIPEIEAAEKILHLEEAILILKESLKWIYDYAPCIIELCNVARGAFKSITTKSYPTRYIESVVLKHYWANKEKYKLPPDLLVKQPGEKTPVLNKLINMTHTAATCIVSFNHGRRRNEVIGERKPYGLYFGCVQPESTGSPYKRIEIYIEKTLQGYAEFWCNKLIVDSVAVLEELYQCSRPLNAEKKERDSAAASARTEKLFTARRFTLNGFRKSPENYNFSTSSLPFLEMAGVPTNCLNGTRAFRRLFAILYVHRYDHPVLLALKQHLRHLCIASTTHYARSAENKSEAERIEKLFRREFAGMAEAIDEARSEYFYEIVVRILKGELIGGGFPRLVSATVKRLSAHVEFRIQAVDEKATVIRDIFERRGYKVSEKEHATCLLGTARGTKRHANCNRDGVPHQEDASPSKCRGCVNAINTENTRTLYEVEREELRRQADDYTKPAAIRMASIQQADRLDELLAQEIKIAEESRMFFEKLFDTWPDLVLGEQTS